MDVNHKKEFLIIFKSLADSPSNLTTGYVFAINHSSNLLSYRYISD